ncbi:MAG: hypothetical protein Q9168_006387 [Polycauliona sp. 1 TL-2023]
MSLAPPGELSLAKLLYAPPPRTLFQQMAFREAEGLTVITTAQSAKDHQLKPTFASRMITCEVHSSLETVGFMAAISKRLTERGIGANPVSGFYHDHLFVPEGKEAEAMLALEDLAKEAVSGDPTETPTL